MFDSPCPVNRQIRLSELADVAHRAATGAAVLDAAAAWAKAPMSIKLMAGTYVAPLMAAIIAINEELHGLKNQHRTDSGNFQG